MEIDGTPPSAPIPIDAARIEAARRALERARADDAPPMRAEPGHDSIALSRSGRQLARISASASAAPDERPQLVARLRAQVEAGTYAVDHDALAALLVDRGAV